MEKLRKPFLTPNQINMFQQLQSTSAWSTFQQLLPKPVNIQQMFQQLEGNSSTSNINSCRLPNQLFRRSLPRRSCEDHEIGEDQKRVTYWGGLPTRDLAQGRIDWEQEEGWEPAGWGSHATCEPLPHATHTCGPCL